MFRRFWSKAYLLHEPLILTMEGSRESTSLETALYHVLLVPVTPCVVPRVMEVAEKRVEESNTVELRRSVCITLKFWKSLPRHYDGFSVLCQFCDLSLFIFVLVFIWQDRKQIYTNCLLTKLQI